MNVSQQIIEVIDNLAQKFGIVIDWGQQNVMPYLQELCEKYIKWEIGTSVMWGMIGILLIIFCIIVIVKCIKSHYAGINWNSDKGDVLCSVGIIGAVCGVMGSIILLCQTFDIAKCCLFPELQMFEYIQHLLR